jgi:hypothetical protein
MDVYQQVDVIRLRAKLNQAATPRIQDFRERCAQVFLHLGRERFPPIFRHENDM